LVSLIRLLDPSIASLNAIQPELAVLSQLAVATRYPGYSASAQIADDALRSAENVRGICRLLLQLPTDN
jgi:hypothetical protein